MTLPHNDGQMDAVGMSTSAEPGGSPTVSPVSPNRMPVITETPEKHRKPLVLPDFQSRPRYGDDNSSYSSTNRASRNREFTRTIEKMKRRLEDKDRELQLLVDKLMETEIREQAYKEDNKRIAVLEEKNNELTSELEKVRSLLRSREKELVSYQMNDLAPAWGAAGAIVATSSSSDDSIVHELEDLRKQRDEALVRAGELAQKLAESKANEDEMAERFKLLEGRVEQVHIETTELDTPTRQKFWMRSSWSPSPTKSNHHNNTKAASISALQDTFHKECVKHPAPSDTPPATKSILSLLGRSSNASVPPPTATPTVLQDTTEKDESSGSANLSTH
jgi:hypothetical protein